MSLPCTDVEDEQVMLTRECFTSGDDDSDNFDIQGVLSIPLHVLKHHPALPKTNWVIL